MKIRHALVCALLSSIPFAGYSAEPVTEVRLYAMDCGHVTIKDARFFSDTGDLDGKTMKAVVSCYLVRHPSGRNLLWDAGLNDELAKTPGGVEAFGGNFHLAVEKPLLTRLAEIGVTPADVTYVAFSHLHFDHTGNANAFARSTWLMNPVELAWATAQTPGFGVDPATISAHKTATIESVAGDHDVFGDGSVVILKGPGHTPGHQLLQLQLAKAGTVVLSGDLYHTHENRKERNVPAINVDRADTLATMDRIEKIVKNRKARFVVQHVQADLDALPRFPRWLD